MANENVVKSMTENARDAARIIARDQQKRPGKKVRVVAIADGFDGFTFREAGSRFIAWWPDELEIEVLDENKRLVKKTVKARTPSWQMEEAEFDKRAKAEAKAERDAADIGE